MKGLKKKRRIQIIALAFAALALSGGLIGYAMRDGINFFRTPSQVTQSPPPPEEIFRIGGLVVAGSLQRGQSETVTFRVTDTAAEVPVSYTGRMVGGVFQATEILAKHDETYMPKEVVDALKEQGVYVDPDGAPNG